MVPTAQCVGSYIITAIFSGDAEKVIIRSVSSSVWPRGVAKTENVDQIRRRVVWIALLHHKVCKNGLQTIQIVLIGLLRVVIMRMASGLSQWSCTGSVMKRSVGPESYQSTCTIYDLSHSTRQRCDLASLDIDKRRVEWKNQVKNENVIFPWLWSDPSDRSLPAVCHQDTESIPPEIWSFGDSCPPQRNWHWSLRAKKLPVLVVYRTLQSLYRIHARIQEALYMAHVYSRTALVLCRTVDKPNSEPPTDISGFTTDH